MRTGPAHNSRERAQLRCGRQGVFSRNRLVCLSESFPHLGCWDTGQDSHLESKKAGHPGQYESHMTHNLRKFSFIWNSSVMAFWTSARSLPGEKGVNAS